MKGQLYPSDSDTGRGSMDENEYEMADSRSGRGGHSCSGSHDSSHSDGEGHRAQ